MPASSESAVGGYRRVHQTRRSVVWADRAARSLIGAGGLFVIFAVLGILVFLVSVVVPMFGDASVEQPLRYQLPPAAEPPLFTEVNEYRALGMTLQRDGTLQSFDARSGALLATAPILPAGARIRCASRHPGGSDLALGLEDGSVLLGRLQFQVEFLTPAEVDDALRRLPVGGSLAQGPGLVEHVAADQYRRSSVQVSLDEPLALTGSVVPLERVDYRPAAAEDLLALLRGDGSLTLLQISKSENIATGEITRELEQFELPREPADTPPSHLLLNSHGDQLYLAWEDGRLLRYSVGRPEAARVAERTDLTPDGAQLTALEFLIGEQTLVAGDSRGGVAGWFRVPAQGDGAGSDGYRLVAAHRPEPQEAAVTAIAVSSRSRAYATADARGDVWLRYMTSDRVLARMEAGGNVDTLQITPKGDGVFALAGREARLWPYRVAHPEATLGTVFGSTWYEGYSGPEFTWQSSSSTDDVEPKLSLIPLIFGTLKATLYAMLFSVPIALLAAIYTSEFLSRRARTAIKPAIEMMASLPSVVLGFLAALVLAPWVEQSVLSVLLVFFLVPVTVVLGAYAWLFVPQRLAARLDGTPKLLATAVAVVLALLAAMALGPLLERAFFGGDFRAWLAPPFPGSSAGFWAGLLFLPGAILATVLRRRLLDPRLAHVHGTRTVEAGVELLKGLAVLLGALVLAYGAGLLLDAFGVDPRGSLVGTYAQRNTLVVGFAMGFAVIPIIYTIAEDALSAVPDHLRGAALGCGATRWQTAVRIVVPTAMSGVFSACMVGLGRAVGETMIVVMAAGNTPILDVNIFNGLRALSATIAMELPEAAKNGTLYRMLFLAALTLFGMTFVVNTAAEVVRQRFRKRAFEL